MSNFQFAQELIDAPFEDEMKKSYLDYAMSVIVGRALPDARDGLKPVHRRVLYSMHESNYVWNRAHVKCARVVGDTMGKYHPHGDSAIYDTLARMAQPFSLRYMLVDGQGNFGSVDGDSPAAMRYTECRLAKISNQLLTDIEKDTVDFGPNYDGKEMEPLVLPTRFPNLLLNGSEGIAVGMATKIPPHNLAELIDGCLAVLDNEHISVDELIKIIPAPDFPTGGLICGLSGSAEAYKTGRGSVMIRAKTHFEDLDRSSKQAIIVDELPYQVNKKVLIERMAELVKNKEIEGITDLRDESDKNGMRMVIELRKGEMPDVILNQLFKRTDLQIFFGINMVALVDGRPELLDLKRCLDIFLEHRREVIVRRTLFDLKVAKKRGHSLEGLAVALSNVDEIVTLIKSAQDPKIAKEALLGKRWASNIVSEMLAKAKTGDSAARPDGMSEDIGFNAHGYQLSEMQADEILQMRLQRLTGMEQDKIIAEYREILVEIDDLNDILAKDERVTEIARQELLQIKADAKDGRRSEIVLDAFNIADEDLIPRRDMIVTLTNVGYIKRRAVEDYSAQKRGGRGKAAADLKEDDIAARVFAANSHDILLCFTNKGRALPIKVYALPEGGRTARGRPLVNYLSLQEGEKLTDLIAIQAFDEDKFLVLATKRGIVKRTSLANYKNIRAGGLIAIDLDAEDELVSSAITNGQQDLMLFCSSNRVNRFAETELRALSRSARGVRGIQLDDSESVIGLISPESEAQLLLTVTDLGYAKRTAASFYRKAKRGGMGVRAIPSSEKIGQLKSVIGVQEGQDVFAITDAGVMIRINAEEIRQTSRMAQGVRLLKLDEGQVVSDVIAFADDSALAGVSDEDEMDESLSIDALNDLSISSDETDHHRGEEDESNDDGENQA